MGVVFCISKKKYVRFIDVKIPTKKSKITENITLIPVDISYE